MTAQNQVVLFLFVMSLARAQMTVVDKTMLGGAPPGAPDAFNNHGVELQQEGRFTEAEAEFRSALNACHESKCAFLPAILNNLGSLLHDLARFREAESLFKQASDAASADGQTPPALPIALVNLAAVYRAEGRYTEAGPLYARALKLRQDDPTTSGQQVPKVLAHMAALNQDMGDLPHAEELIRKAVAVFRADESLGSPDGLAALVNMSTILASEGKFAEAESTGRRALAVYRTQPPGPDYATALNAMGSILATERRPKDAEPFLREAVTVWEKVLGMDHPTVALGLMNLGTVLQARRRYTEAEAAMTRASQIDARNLPADHPRIAVDLDHQAVLLVARKRYREAEEMLLRAAAILQQRVPAAELGQILANLGEVYRLEKRVPESRENFARGLKILNDAWGPLDLRLLAWLNNYASVLRASEEYAEAGKIELQATRIRVTEIRRRAA